LGLYAASRKIAGSFHEEVADLQNIKQYDSEVEQHRQNTAEIFPYWIMKILFTFFELSFYLLAIY
jgi:hypothetical protein